MHIHIFQVCIAGEKGCGAFVQTWSAVLRLNNSNLRKASFHPDADTKQSFLTRAVSGSGDWKKEGKVDGWISMLLHHIEDDIMTITVLCLPNLPSIPPSPALFTLTWTLLKSKPLCPFEGFFFSLWMINGLNALAGGEPNQTFRQDLHTHTHRNKRRSYTPDPMYKSHLNVLTCLS